MPSAISKHALIIGLMLCVGLAGCRNDPPTITPVPAPGQSSSGGTGGDQLSIEVRNSELALGLERFAFLIKDAAGNPIRDGDVSVRFFRLLDGAVEPSPAADGEALYFGQGMPDGGSWVAYTDFDASGPWGLEVELSRADGSKGVASLEVDVAGKTASPRVGQLAPQTEVARLGEDVDAASLTSDDNPLDALYATSLAEATANDKPSVVFLGSYAHCPTDLCRASLSALKSLQPRYADRVNFLHFETHDLEDPAQFSAAYQVWGLATEPWFFFLDKSGRVLSRVEGGLDSTELDLLTRLTLGEQVTKPQP